MELEAYIAVRNRICDVIEAATGEEPVPACPGWTIHDVTAHMAGLCQDWVANRLADYASHPWTDAQVRRFHGQSLEGILLKWGTAMEAFGALAHDDVLGRPPAGWAFGDAVIHEADIRGALGTSRVPREAVALSLKASISRWRETLGASKALTLHIISPEIRDWWLGTVNDPLTIRVEVLSYELFRALAGRRSQTQVRSWKWEGDPSPFLAAGLPYPFTWADTDLID